MQRVAARFLYGSRAEPLFREGLRQRSQGAGSPPRIARVVTAEDLDGLPAESSEEPIEPGAVLPMKLLVEFIAHAPGGVCPAEQDKHRRIEAAELVANADAGLVLVPMLGNGRLLFGRHAGPAGFAVRTDVVQRQAMAFAHQEIPCSVAGMVRPL